MKGFGGIGALLRYKSEMVENYGVSKDEK